MQKLEAIFQKIKGRFDERGTVGDGLVCKQGFYKNSHVLKLQKAFWTNDPMDQVPNKSGIFFSIWIDEKSAHVSRTNYNIHALKLRELKNYSITSRDFADEFRKNFASMKKSWPNVSMDYGPLTLMEGWIPINQSSLEEELFCLLKQFQPVSQLIDRLLEKRAR